MATPLTFTDLRAYLVHTPSTDERIQALERAAANCAATVALLEKTEARRGLVGCLLAGENG